MSNTKIHTKASLFLKAFLLVFLFPIFLLLSPPVASAAAPTTGLVGYWNFDEGSGSTASDTSGNNNSGTLVNSPNWTAGKVGSGALSFDGADDYVSLSPQFLDGATAGTIALWIKPTSVGGTAYSGVRNAILGKISSPDNAFGFSETTNRLRLRLGNVSMLDSNTSLTVGSWYHVVAEWDSNSMKIFINGSLDSSNSVSGVSWFSSGAGSQIGRATYNTSFTNSFNGTMDEMRIYSRALSAQEVSDIYNDTSLTPTPTPTTSPTPTPASSPTPTPTPSPSPTASPTPAPTSGTDVYIAQAQAGNGDGSACANALPVSFFNSPANWGNGATQIGPGKTVHLCGIVTGGAGASGILTFQGSGLAGNPITLKFEPGASISAPYCNWIGNGSGCLIVSKPSSPRHDIVIDGGTPCGWTLATGKQAVCNGSIVNTANGTNLANKAPTNAIEMDSCTNCEVKNISIRNMYIQSGGDTNADPQGQNCINFSGVNNSIHDSEFHDAGWCIHEGIMDGGSNNKIYHNDIYNSPHPYFLSGGGTANASNTYFYENHLHDFANWDTPNCTYHIEGIHTYGNIGSGSYPLLTGFYVYNNVFDGDSSYCLFADVYLSGNTYAAGTAGAVNNAIVFNNIIATSHGSNGGIAAGAGNGNAVYNNTIVNPGVAQFALSWSNVSQNLGNTFVFKNNIISGGFSLTQTNDPAPVNGGITADYNVYSNCNSIGSCFGYFATGGTSSWTQYLANPYGQDQHSKAFGLTNNICCTNASLGLNTIWAPQTGSPVIGIGTNLSSLCKKNGGTFPDAFCSDIAGAARPSSGPWDIGAYQYTGSTSSPPPATPAPVAGDFNLDHIVNSLDYSLLNSKWNQNYSVYDLLVDGLINSFDYAVLKSNWNKTW